jgi:hypothetical protein
VSAIAQDAGEARAEAVSGFGAWNPGVRSQIPGELRELCTIFRPEHSFTSEAEAAELADLTGLPASELVAFRPRRLALHAVLIRVTANLSVPDGLRIEDLGINFRRMTQTLLDACVEPRMPEIERAYDALRRALSGHVERALQRHVERALAAADGAVDAAPEGAPGKPKRRFFRWLDWRRSARPSAVGAQAKPSGAPAADEGPDRIREAAERAVARVTSALQVRHGRIWGGHDVITRVATDLACNDLGSDEIGALIEPWLADAAAREGYRVLPRQDAPVVMNTKGPSASGKSTLRPLQRRLAADIGVDWSEFALISPDIWRKQLIDYESLGAVYRYGAMFTGEELAIVDHKLDRYMAGKGERGDMPHLLIDRFRFDSFAPDSNEAGSNLLTRFGHVVYLFFMITPPESLVERAWNRGLEVGRYKAVDDTLAHGVEAYSGMPEVFFTWVRRTDKRVHFEFLDNSVAQGERPRTVAFGWNGTLNVLDVGRLLDVERYRRVNVDATSPAALYPDPQALAPSRNTGFLAQCVEQFATVHFAAQDTGRICLRIERGAPAFIDGPLLDEVLRDPDTRAGIAAIAPAALEGGFPAASRPAHLHEVAGFDTAHTLGSWGKASAADAAG